MAVSISITLTNAEALAVLRAQLTAGYGVRRSAALIAAESKLKAAIESGTDRA